jgi:hypothetical protein
MIKKIYMYWDRGWSSAPTLAKKCRDSWIRNNPDWEIFTLDDKNVSDFIELPPSKWRNQMKIQTWSDIIRVKLIKKSGGCWVDASCYCNKPLNGWLPKNIKAGFFGFSNPTPDKLLSNWFLYSDKEGDIVNSLHNRMIEFWENFNGGGYDYFWSHYMINDVFEEYPSLYRKMGKLSSKINGSDNPHRFVPYHLSFKEVLTNDNFVYRSPVYKLNLSLNLNNDSSVGRFLNYCSGSNHENFSNRS